MTMTTVFTVALGILGGLAATMGITRIVRDPRRLSSYAYSIVGLGAAVLSLGLILYIEADYFTVLTIAVLTAASGLLLGNLIGYPLLVGFLLWAGFTAVRREARSLANMLSLIVGIVLLLLPATLGLVEPRAVARDDVTAHLQFGVHLALLLLVAYLACCFSIFAIASVAYRFRKPRSGSAAIIVLGAGLVGGTVSPLLAGRLQRGITAQRQDTGRPVIITSGGQGEDEPCSEGSAMRDYLLDQDIAPDQVIAEEESTSTRQNLTYSSRLLPEPGLPVTVVTSSYHVLRAALLTRALGMRAQVVGAPTSWSDLPGALVREFAAVMRDHIRIHVVAVSAIIVLTMAVTQWIVPDLTVDQLSPR